MMMLLIGDTPITKETKGRKREEGGIAQSMEVEKLRLAGCDIHLSQCGAVESRASSQCTSMVLLFQLR